MSVQIVVPTMGESVTEATVARWLKNIGDAVQTDEPLVELETDKVTLEVNSPTSGKIVEIKAQQGGTVGVGAILGLIEAGAVSVAAKPAAAAPAPAPAATPAPAPAPVVDMPTPVVSSAPATPFVMPAARKQAEDRGIDPASIPGSGKDGRVMKQDVLAYAAQPQQQAPAPRPYVAKPAGPREERVRLSRLRQRIAERLKQAQNTAAMLTTFNEVDMSRVMALRSQHKEAFEKKHGTKLGFMSFFVKACVLALQEIPAINAQIDGEDLVYKNYYDIGVAVGTENGLVVPVLRDADTMGFADIEKSIADMGKRARAGKLTMEELSGGTFTITNGGIYGSMMSTPILNPPQSGILGMHAIKERPVAVDGKIEIRPMMYLALSYDHRVVDGREAVTFLVRIKECLEDPERLLLSI